MIEAKYFDERGWLLCVERWGGGEAGFKSFEIGVNIAEQQYAHESPDKLPIID